MNSRRALLITAGLCLAAASMARADVRFLRQPVATRTADGVKIEFSVSAATDCEVSIVDANGKVIRHLAAGMLGENAPPPLARGTLEQSLAWDGKNDIGAPAGDGPFEVRVRLGLLPTFGGLIGHNPAAIGPIHMLATGPGGEVFVMHSSFGFGNGASHMQVVVFGRQGNYLRTILPPPADRLDQCPGLKLLEVEKGVKVPFVYNGETRGLVPGIGGERAPHRGIVTRDGRLAMSVAQEIHRRPSGPAEIIVVNTDGTVAAPIRRTLVSPNSSRTFASMALSPDEKSIYAAGLRIDSYGLKPDHAIYTFGWNDKEMKVLAGDKTESGNSPTRFNEPTSVAVDKDGQIYVTDKGNDRIVVLKPDGTFIRSLPFEKPERVEVHHRTGAVYVLGGPAVDTLARFDSAKSEKPAITATLPAFKHRLYTAVLALDSEADRPVLWVGSHHSVYTRFSLVRVEDAGEAFTAPTDVIDKSKPSGAKATDIAWLPGADAFVMWSSREVRPTRAFSISTGELLKMQFPRIARCGEFLAAGRDGNYYVYHGFPDAMVSRFDAKFQQIPYPTTQSGAIEKLGSPRTRGRGLSVDARGNLYVLVQKGDPTAGPDKEGRYGDANAVQVYDRDGKLLHEALVDSDIRSLNSVCVDPAGNVYLQLGARPKGKFVPDNLAGQVPDGPADPDADCGHNYYPLMYGTIVKFGPEGGQIRGSGDGGVPMTFGYEHSVNVHNAKWMFFGASTVPSWRTPKTPNICLCESNRMDVDGFGRVFFPDACGFRVGVLDSAGNLIRWFGTYGNNDSAGPESKLPTPAIPLGWPAAVSVGDGMVLVGDRLNSRVLRVKLDAAATASCKIE